MSTTLLSKSEQEVILFLVSSKIYPLPKKVNRSVFDRHQKAFLKLKGKGITDLSASSIWCLTIKGWQLANVILVFGCESETIPVAA